MAEDLADAVDGTPERFVPQEMRGELVEAEHLTRYWWAAQLVAGREVLDAGSGAGYGTAILAATAAGATGVDIVEPVVAAATAAYPEATFTAGDVAALPFEDDAFDVVVCFEVIEHVAAQEAVVAELARVLRPGGVLAISSPNRDVYMPGNPHHVHELTPAELDAMLRRHWPVVELHQQHDFTTSVVFAGELTGEGADVPGTLRTLAEQRPGTEVYTVALASDDAIPPVDNLATLAAPLEVRRWMEQFGEQQAALERLYDHVRCAEDREAERRAALTRLAEAEAEAAEAVALCARVAGLERALADANRREAALAEGLRRADAERMQLGAQIEHLDRVIHDVTGSLSWRVTRPLRAAKRAAGGA